MMILTFFLSLSLSPSLNFFFFLYDTQHAFSFVLYLMNECMIGVANVNQFCELYSPSRYQRQPSLHRPKIPMRGIISVTKTGQAPSGFGSITLVAVARSRKASH